MMMVLKSRMREDHKDNLWYNIQNDVDAPRKSIAYASGIEYEDSIDILKLLRSDLGRNSEGKI